MRRRAVQRYALFSSVTFLFSLPLMLTASPPAPPQAAELSARNPAHWKLAAAYSAAHRGISLLVMVDGKIVFEDYPNGGAATRAHELASGTKSFSGALAVAAQQDGLLTLDEKVSDTITEWRSDSRKAAITIRELLQLTSGIEGGGIGRPPAYADAIGAQVTFAPGERFQYGPAPFQIFGELMRRKLEPGKRSPLEYLKQRIFAPIGLEVGAWRTDRDGNPHLPSGASLTARNWAKFGEMVRLGGAWQGKQILPAELLEQCFVGSKANPAYGLTWWLNRAVDARQRAMIPVLWRATDVRPEVAAIPADLVFAAGAGDQRLFISRTQRLVVVRQADGIAAALMGQRSGYSDAEFLSRLLAGTDARGKRLTGNE